MVTVRQAWVGLVLLLLVVMLIVIFMAYWHQVTGTNIMPLLA
ncbi:MAG TPA: hypothetical protein VJQ26_07325 [Ktedonobacteraceae bacterium]|nr:hypothetical protein [Ktedonobacteraceae bacterium]